MLQMAAKLPDVEKPADPDTTPLQTLAEPLVSQHVQNAFYVHFGLCTCRMRRQSTDRSESSRGYLALLNLRELFSFG